MTGLYAIGVLLLISCVVAAIEANRKAKHPPKPPVRFLGDDGEYHYLPGDDPADHYDPWKDYTPHDI